MMNKSDYQKNHPEIHEGMTAYNIDGEKLGKVIDLTEDGLTVEKGFFFPKDYTFHYDDITDIQADSLIINQEHAGTEGRGPFEQSVAEDTKPKPQSMHEAENTEIPLYEEQLKTERVQKEKGEAVIKKVVHTETRTIDVPVSKEEVVIERKVATGEGTAPGEKAFKEEEIRIPISEEEVKVTKQPVEKERVEIRKEVRTGEKKVSEELRSENVEVEEKGEVKKEKRE